ncbi:hypothetical protein [Pantoea sp. ARC270]|uniref:hypothetical protein n=1 Tax=Pantoea sp. ARC270 TaxID=2027923 RepID=UPI0011B4AD98|nr:hypothetical protein [Pantoea sp. ARC270]
MSPFMWNRNSTQDLNLSERMHTTNLHVNYTGVIPVFVDKAEGICTDRLQKHARVFAIFNTGGCQFKKPEQGRGISLLAVWRVVRIRTVIFTTLTPGECIKNHRLE